MQSTRRSEAIETKYNVKIGVYAIDTNNGNSFSYRQDERFPFQSTVKMVVAAAATTAVETKAVSIPAEQVAVFWTDTLASKVSDAIQNTEADSGKKNINSELRKAQNDKNAIKAEELLNQLLLGKLQRAIGFTTAKKGTKPEMQRLNEELIDARKNNDFVRAEQLINQLQNLDHQFKK